MKPAKCGKGSATRYTPAGQAAIAEAIQKAYGEAKYDELIKREALDLEDVFKKALRQQSLISKLQSSGKFGSLSKKETESNKNASALEAVFNDLVLMINRGELDASRAKIQEVDNFLKGIELTSRIKDNMYRYFVSLSRELNDSDMTDEKEQVIQQFISVITKYLPFAGVGEQLGTFKTPKDFVFNFPNIVEQAKIVLERFGASGDRRLTLLGQQLNATEEIIKDYQLRITTQGKLAAIIPPGKRKLPRSFLALLKAMNETIQEFGVEGLVRDRDRGKGDVGSGRKMTKAQFKKQCKDVIRNLVRSVEGTDRQIENALIKEVMEM